MNQSNEPQPAVTADGWGRLTPFRDLLVELGVVRAGAEMTRAAEMAARVLGADQTARRAANRALGQTEKLRDCHLALSALIAELEPTMPSSARDEAQAYLAATAKLEG